LGHKELSEYIQHVRTDHSKIPQQLNLSLKTGTAEVCGSEIALLLDSRHQVIRDMNWDGFEAAQGTLLKAAVISEDDDCMFLLLLEVTGDDIYERCGSFDLYKETLTGVGGCGTLSALRIWHDDSEEEGSSHERDHGGTWTYVRDVEDLDPADKERLRTSFGDLDTYEWWKDVFTEEGIIIG
jgi:hypothetical protein